eukprot:CAMPEP_0197623774 /NCGR_PEP_ID=MMETSP1338-20131121/3705_1 /TAXON_ID=43686 ORGANISM="Pelagodinium beii, Strain RCC1491" /NCGR_SAMPLE_ID=MMETSP1338 /ASSEMBLY_ACC=CAM_ASM_000754 /LENGTH=795 /DNA_ID=CAMNT_0043193847 /DNA_START=219 /DNA_END=2606 /DNA_ORIENTATION=-
MAAEAVGATKKLVRREQDKPLEEQQDSVFLEPAVCLLRLLAFVIPCTVMAALFATIKVRKEDEFKGCEEEPWTEDLGLEPVSAVAAAVAATQVSAGRGGKQKAVQEKLLLHWQFEEMARKLPNAPAVLSPWGKEKVMATFGDLEAASNQLARWLRREGLKQAAPAAVALIKAVSSADALPPRPCELHQAALLAVLKCGSPYVPIDARDWPPARQRFVLDDCGASILLADAPLKAPAAQEVRKQKVLLLSEMPTDLSAGPLTEPGFGAKEFDLCHVLYTSGSTGRPKGVLTSHRAAASRCKWMRSEMPFAAGEVAVTRTPLCFVDHVWETFGPLGAGIPVCDFPHTLRSHVSRLATALEACKVTRLVMMPSLGRRLLDSCEGKLPSALRQVTYSGEDLTVDLLRRTMLSLPNGAGASVLNLYGSTEVAADVTWQMWLRDSDAVKAWLADTDMKDLALAASAGLAPLRAVPDLYRPTLAPLGCSIPGCEVFVCNPETLSPVANGQVGELIVTGAHLAEGYLGKTPETQRQFLHVRIARRGNVRAFRTGDFGFEDDEGMFWYVGREDDMMKIRGERIDLKEVQTAVELVLGCGFLNHEGALQAPAAPAAAARQALLEAIPSTAELAMEVAVLAYEEEQTSDARLAVLLAVPRDAIPLNDSDAHRVESSVRAALHGMLPLSAVPWRILFFPAATPKTAFQSAGTKKGEVLFPRLSSGKTDREALKAFLEANVANPQDAARDGNAAAGCLPWTWSSEGQNKEPPAVQKKASATVSKKTRTVTAKRQAEDVRKAKVKIQLV